MHRCEARRRAWAILAIAAPFWTAACGSRKPVVHDASADRQPSDAERTPDALAETASSDVVDEPTVDAPVDAASEPPVDLTPETDVGAPETVTPLTASTYFTLYEATGCQHDVKCGGDRDEAHCPPFVSRSRWAKTLIAGAGDGHIIFDAAKARACIDDIGARSCLNSQRDREVRNSPCAEVFAGTRTLGAPCFFAEDCVAGAQCAKPNSCLDDCCTGSCQMVTTTPMTYAHLGEACYVGHDCSPDLFCYPSTCRTYAAEGQPCTISEECDDVRDFCDPATHVCVVQRRAGASCADSSYACGFGSACHQDIGQCENFPALGDPCGPQAACVFFTCDPSTNTCVSDPPVTACP
jgi:hypothetical protein